MTVNVDVKKTLDALGERRSIVESGGTASGWFRKWSDGFLEQGGHIDSAGFHSQKTITLPTPFSNSNYVVNASTREVQNGGNCIWELCCIRSVKNNSFVLFNGGGNTPMSWHACGYV